MGIISIVYNYIESSTLYDYDTSINLIIQVNAPAVPLASDWAITHIVFSDSDLRADALDKGLIDYLPYEES